MDQQDWEFEHRSSMEWTDPADKSTWSLELYWRGPVEPTGAVECVGLSLQPAGTPRPLMTSRLRRLNLATLIGREKAKLAATARRVAELPPPEWAEDSDRLAAEVRAARTAQTELAEALRSRPERQPRPGRPAAYDRSHFEQVARVYKENYVGVGSAPTKGVAAWAGVTVATAKKWVARARKMGLLGPTTPGQPGGVRPSRRR